MGEGQRLALRQQPKKSRMDERRTLSWAWPIFPIVGKLRQEECEFEASQGYTERQRKGKKRKNPIALTSFPELSLASSSGNYHHAVPLPSAFLTPKKGALTHTQRSVWEAEC